MTIRVKAQEKMPQGATNTFDLQIGEVWQQVRVLESFVLEEMNSMTPKYCRKIQR